MKIDKNGLFSFLGLFSSLSTIFCCALPIILVTLGMGASFAAITANVPGIIWLAQHSLGVFIFATIMLSVSGYFIFIKPQSCPIDPELAKLCTRSKKISKWVWSASVAIFATSIFFKYFLILLIR